MWFVLFCVLSWFQTLVSLTLKGDFCGNKRYLISSKVIIFLEFSRAII